MILYNSRKLLLHNGLRHVHPDKRTECAEIVKHMGASKNRLRWFVSTKMPSNV